MEFGPWTYAGAFILALALALLFTPLALRFAQRKQVLDHPGSYKIQESPIPYLGGLAIVASFVVVMLSAALIAPTAGGVGELAVILLVGLCLSLLGLVDDLRGLHPAARFTVEIAAAVLLFWLGVRVELFQNIFLDGFVTVVWVVGIANAFNLLDNMDGLSAGVATIASAAFFLIALVNDQFLVAALAAALAGCSLGFLRHNFHPARIYMGDAGSLFLGFLLAVIGIKLRFEAPRQITFMVPILILGVAIVDTILVVTSRLAHGRNPFSGGRDHISHRLVFVGIPVRIAVSLIYMGGVTLGWLALVMSRLDVASGYILMALIIVVGAFLTTLLYMVPVYENSKRKRIMIQEVAEHDPEENTAIAADRELKSSATA